MAKEITVTDLKSKLDNKEDFVLIDVREPHEHQEFNVGGILMPLGTIPARIHEIENKDAEVVLYCRSGGRSGQAQRYFMENGFTNVINLRGGMLSWGAVFGG